MPSSHAAHSVFISSSPEDREAAKKLFHALRQANISVWFEEESLLPGQKRDIAIRSAIRESRFFLVLLSSHSVKRGQVNREVTRALELIDEFPENDIFVIPVRLDACEPAHEKLRELVMTDLFPDWNSGVKKILLTIHIQINTDPESDISQRNTPNAANPLPDAPPVQNRPEEEHSGTVQSVPPNEKEKPPSLLPAFAVLLILIGAITGIGFISRNALFTLLDRYSRDFSIFAVYAGFTVISLTAAVVMFGIMRSSGMFRKTGKQEQYEFGGAMAGFLVTLMFLIIAHSLHSPAPVFLEISGNIRFVQEGKPTGPVYGATVSLAGVSGHRTETDKDGNFRLHIPDDRQMQEIEIMADYQSQTQYKKIQRAEAGNVKMEIPKPPEVKIGTVSPDVKIVTRSVREMKGIVRFVKNGQAMGPAAGAEISDTSAYSRTESDMQGHFSLAIYDFDERKEIKLQVKYQSETHMIQIAKSAVESGKVVIEIPVTDDAEKKTSDAKTSVNVETKGDKSPAVVSNGDVTVNYK
ncbi:MAG: toll/interleukin-1 receptor domain-containing protein [Desulfococcaceae bacterium]